MSYYLIRVQSVSDSGRSIEATSSQDDWLKKMIKDALTDKISTFDAKLSAKISRFNRSLEITGGVYIEAKVECDRCLEIYSCQEQIPFRIILEPAPKKGSKENDSDSEDIDDILDFSYYHGDEVDVGDVIRQHIDTAQPITYRCSDDCKGLCPQCGKNLNKEECNCQSEDENSPFAALGRYKTH